MQLWKAALCDVMKGGDTLSLNCETNVFPVNDVMCQKMCFLLLHGHSKMFWQVYLHYNNFTIIEPTDTEVCFFFHYMFESFPLFLA